MPYSTKVKLKIKNTVFIKKQTYKFAQNTFVTIESLFYEGEQIMRSDKDMHVIRIKSKEVSSK